MLVDEGWSVACMYVKIELTVSKTFNGGGFRKPGLHVGTGAPSWCHVMTVDTLTKPLQVGA